jgi:hypothetical protein
MKEIAIGLRFNLGSVLWKVKTQPLFWLNLAVQELERVFIEGVASQ